MTRKKSIVNLLCGLFVLLFGWQIQYGRASEGQDRVSDTEIVKGELEAVADSAAQANARLAKLEKELADYKRSNDAKVRQIGNFNFGGDIRMRYEGFFQEGTDTRHRNRFRLRFNVTGNLSDEFSGGFSLAAGTLDDPISTNQTLTGFFNRKNIGIDRAFITYRPAYAGFLRLDAGKFAFPWQRTGLTFDSDINPEGFAQTMSFDLDSSVLRNLTLVAFQLPFSEIATGHDSYVFGGQIQARMQISPKVRLSLFGAGINFRNADVIARSQFGTNITLRPSLSNTNTLRMSGNTVLGYEYRFAYLDTIMRLDVDTHSKFPMTLQFNFVNNVRGPRERSGYWADITFGRTSAAKDIQFGYSIVRVERDAVIGALSESDLRASTDVINHRVQFAYLFARNVTGQFTAWIGRRVNTPTPDNHLRRLQFDISYRF